MKKTLLVIVTLVACASLGGLSVAQPKICFFDLKRIILESKAGKEAQTELKTFSGEKKRILKKEDL